MLSGASSYPKAAMGSTPDALWAGTEQATSATMKNTSETLTKVAGSVAVTPTVIRTRTAKAIKP